VRRDVAYYLPSVFRLYAVVEVTMFQASVVAAAVDNMTKSCTVARYRGHNELDDLSVHFRRRHVRNHDNGGSVGLNELMFYSFFSLLIAELQYFV